MKLAIKFWRSTRRNFSRVIWPAVIGTLFIKYGADIALFTGMPELSPWSLFIGGSLYAFAISHVLRRLYFPTIDLGDYARKAFGQPTGAGLVFIGVCLVIVALIQLLGAAIRV